MSEVKFEPAIYRPENSKDKEDRERKWMRDQFAMAALTIVEVKQEETDKKGAAAIAYAAYLIADAMMKERAK